MASDTQLRDALLAELWRRGDVASLLLDSNQLAAYHTLKASDASRYVFEWSRRLGKTWMLVLIAVEECLKGPGRRVAYGASTIKALREFVQPAFEGILRTCPEAMRARYNKDTSHWTFPHNGSFVHLFGCDDKHQADAGRGPTADLGIMDEAGFVPILDYVLRSVIRPQLLTTGGRLIVASTPAEEADHDFTRICERAEANGHLSHKVIYDNPRLTPERIEEFIAEDARDEGMSVEEYKQTATFRREYLAERVVDKTLTAMGDDWEQARPTCFAASERPKYFDAYVGLDMGGGDPHAVVFGYLDFPSGVLVVEDELLLREGENTAQLAEAIKAKERALWHVEQYSGKLRGLEPEQVTVEHWEGAPEQPYIRVADNDTQMLQDLRQLHGLAFVPTGQKDAKEWMVNAFRVLVRQGKVRIHPRCIQTDRHLRTTLWKNEKRTEFRRKNGEHGDLVDALIYLARRVNWGRNPFPFGWNVGPGEYLPLAARRKKEPSPAEALAKALYSRPRAPVRR